MPKLKPEDLGKISERMRRMTIRIFSEHVIGGEIVTEYVLAIGSERVS